MSHISLGIKFRIPLVDVQMTTYQTLNKITFAVTRTSAEDNSWQQNSSIPFNIFGNRRNVNKKHLLYYMYVYTVFIV